ncbi:MAG TPA: flagellar hook capping FlgD N-terminal domain-containing protein [Terracidiphilus sp.]|nr:flagellar hook capping FlgD N-terminal domain-containing protein [Terracidiphilus sp.]
MATTGIWNHAAASISLAKAHPMDGSAGTGGGTGTSTGGANIGANDFLTLLVTEMQNQDPTATTDPNEYINQLVNVNSLEQLIQINQTLSTATGAGPGGAGAAVPAARNATGPVADPAAQVGTTSGTTGGARANSAVAALADSPVPVTMGNIGLPQTTPSALGVAQALGSGIRRH